jgi:WD40 repeat protein
LLQPSEPDGLLVLSADGRRLASARNEAVRVWDLSGPAPRSQTLSAKVGTVHGLAFSPDAKTLVVGGANRNLHIWDLGDAAAKEQAIIPHTGYYWSALHFSPNGQFFIGCNQQEGVILFDATTWKKLRQWLMPSAVSSAAFVGDSRHVAVGNFNGTIYILRLDLPPTVAGR